MQEYKRALRRSKEQSKYKRRLKIYRTEDKVGWQKLLKNHSTLCSCFMCSGHRKYVRDKDFKKHLKGFTVEA